MLKQWSNRIPEEAFLFNPAFLGSLEYEFIKAYGGKDVPLTYLPVFLSIVLHGKTRERLPSSTVTALYEWLQQNEDLLIGFFERVKGILPYSREATTLLLFRKSIELDHGHFVKISSFKTHFPAQFLRTTTSETRQIIDKSKFLGRWFSKSGSESSILALWGVAP